MRAIIIPGISFNPGPLSLYVESCGNGRDSDGNSVANMFGYSKYFCGDMANMGGDLQLHHHNAHPQFVMPPHPPHHHCHNTRGLGDSVEK